MKKLILLCLIAPVGAQTYPDWVRRFEANIVAFEAQPFPDPDGVVFAGNSNFSMWRDIKSDLAPIPVIKRGFGGSTAIELRYYMDRMITPYRAKALVICEGENDLGRGYSPQQITDLHAEIIQRTRERRADTDIVIIALKPSPNRWGMWNRFQQTNALLKSLCESLSRCLYIDTSAAILKNGAPDPLLFRDDELHLNNDAGYDKWTAVIKPKLLAFLNNSSPPKKPKPPEALHVDD